MRDWSWMGWVATAVFASSYLYREPAALRRVQAVGALLWIAYGVLIHAAPVVVANAIVAIVAVASSVRAGSPGTAAVVPPEG